MESDGLYLLSFVKENTPGFDYVVEIMYPFGNYKADYMSKFILAVKSPRSYYYTDIFASFLLSPDEAWNLYSTLFHNQQTSECVISDENYILEPIPNHLETLEAQFKFFYCLAYKNVVDKIDLNSNIK